MTEYQDCVNKLTNAIICLENQVDKQLKLDRDKTDELKKLYKDNHKLKRQYQVLSKQVEDCIKELRSIKKLHGQN